MNKILYIVLPLILFLGIYATQTSNEITSIISNVTYKIAFVKPTFTGAAYNNAFYDFYLKYGSIKSGVPVYSDLNLLTGTIPTGTPVNNTSLFKAYQDEINYESSMLPNSKISAIDDTDVHYGKIFDSTGNNIYDLLVMGHAEYVTQAE